MAYIRSPMNYMGGKYKLLDSIIPSFPKSIDSFVDIFAGGLNVGINIDANKIYVNDQITYLIDIYKMFNDREIDDLLIDIEKIIKEYDLSITNVEGYNALRDRYNTLKSPLDLFVLTCYSFNHQIRFNSKHLFNVPFGKDRSCYNEAIKSNLIAFINKMHNADFYFSNIDFREFDYSLLKPGDLIYCDPPYLITTGTYNDGKRGFNGWSQKDDDDLLQLLDELNDNSINFALSNVFAHKGVENTRLIKWSKDYKVHFIDKTYDNCSYHFKDKGMKTIEVLITNYE